MPDRASRLELSAAIRREADLLRARVLQLSKTVEEEEDHELVKCLQAILLPKDGDGFVTLWDILATGMKEHGISPTPDAAIARTARVIAKVVEDAGPVGRREP